MTTKWFFSARAAIISFVTFLVGLAAAIPAMAGPLSRIVGVAATQRIEDYALIIVLLSGAHLLSSKSVIPTIANERTVSVPDDSLTIVKSPVPESVAGVKTL